MSSEKINFTKAAISAITPPSTGRSYYRDETTRNLIIDVQKSGTVAFQVYRKVAGVPKRIVLGRFDPNLPESRDLPLGTDPLTLIGNTADLNVRMARKLADAVNASLDRGMNPSQQARQVRALAAQELTLRQAFDRYHAEHLVPHEKRTAEDLSNDFDRYLGKVAPGQKKLRGVEKAKSTNAVDWEARKLSSISPADVRGMMLGLKTGVGLRTANKAFVLLRSIFNKMIAWKAYSGENPCAGIEKFKEDSRDRFLNGDELPRFMAAVEKIDHQDFRDFILLSLFTAARRENVLAMRWQDLNFHGGIWTIPGEFSKNGDALTVPITSVVNSILERRRTAHPKGAGFVFPANSASGHIAPPNKRWKALLLDAGIENLRLHDLRRSLGSWAARGGTSLQIIGQMLGHKSNDATAVYARLHFDPVKEAMEAATQKMLQNTLPEVLIQ